MKPNDANGKLPPDARPFRVLLIAGSDRRQYDCPGIDSKARALMFRMGDRLPQEWEIDLEDLGRLEPRTDPDLQCLRLDFDGAVRLAM
jgi:hypothetical protein